LAITIIAMAAIGLTRYGAIPVLAHGGKNHGETEFTAFQAVRKASQLYDRLIIEGKLDGAWESGLSSITINTRQTDGKKEFVVKFMRSQGEPDSVYFFFDQKGKYAGSNFSGK
jgi:hypothetical protein